MNMLFWIAIFCIFLLVAKPLLYLLDCAINDEDQRNFNKFQRDAHARGVSGTEMFQELDVRVEFARLRRIASDRVVNDPENWKAHLDLSVKEAFEHLAGINPELLPMLGGMLRHLPYDHILYRDACAAVDKVTVPRYRAFQDADYSAALRTIR